MSEAISTGAWQVQPGREGDFIREWTRFVEWASTMPGATTFRLSADLSDPQRYVSFAPWDSLEAADAWKQSPEFRERIAQVLQYVADFQSAQLSVVAVVSATAGAGID